MITISFNETTYPDGTVVNVPSQAVPQNYKLVVAGEANSYVFYQEGDIIPDDIIAKMNPVSE